MPRQGRVGVVIDNVLETTDVKRQEEYLLDPAPHVQDFFSDVASNRWFSTKPSASERLMCSKEVVSPRSQASQRSVSAWSQIWCECVQASHSKGWNACVWANCFNDCYKPGALSVNLPYTVPFRDSLVVPFVHTLLNKLFQTHNCHQLSVGSRTPMRSFVIERQPVQGVMDLALTCPTWLRNLSLTSTFPSFAELRGNMADMKDDDDH